METSPREEPETDREAKLFSIIGKKDFQIEELQRENAALRSELGGLGQQRDGARGLAGNILKVEPKIAGQMAIDATGKPGESEHETLRRTHGELDWRYKSLEALHRGCDSKIMALDAKCKHYKSMAWAWKQYIDKKQNRGPGEKARPSTSDSEQTAPPANGRPAVEPPPADRSRTPRPALKVYGPLLGGNTRREQMDPLHSATCSSPLAMQSSIQIEQPQAHEPTVGSSQTIVSEEENQHSPANARVEVRHSDEEPELISERCLKRRAPRALARQSPPRRIKRESSPLSAPIVLSSDGPPESCGCGDDECVCDDLDYVRPSTEQADRSRARANRASSVEHVSVMPQLHRSASSLSEGDPRVHVSAPISVNSKMNEQIRAPLPVANATLISPRGNKDALKTLSANIPLLPRTRQSPKNTPRGGGARGNVSVLSEDGDDSSQVIIPTPKDVEVPLHRKDATLDGLLMGHVTDRTPEVPRRLHVPEHKDQSRTPAPFRTPASLFKAKSPSKRQDARTLPRGIEPPPPSHRPEEELLRLRDVRTLKLDDFRINPKYLGSEFAFADTLRGRDQRRALHVCSKPECCGGAMQTVIMMGGQKVSGKTDAQALDDYLGPQYKQIMGTYDIRKQKNTVLQAHVHAFTKQHGKHRQAFERQSTPPNFWRTDFATTQENQEDRQTALEKDRQDVEARHREAMREGGRWKFRDE